MRKSTLVLYFCFLLFLFAGCKPAAGSFIKGSLEWNPEGNIQYIDSSMALDISDSVFPVSYSGRPGYAKSVKDYVSFSVLHESDSQAKDAVKKIKISAADGELKALVDTKGVSVSKPVFLKMKISDDFSEYEIIVSISKTEDNSDKKKTAVVSDIHLTDERAAYFGYNPLKENKKKLLAYLAYVKENASSYKELVILGDLIDDFSTGLYNPETSERIRLFAKPDGTPVSQFEYEQLIASYNEDVISALKAVGNAGVHLVYVPGNHDQYVTSESINQIFEGKIRQVRDEENPLLGLYSPEVFPNAILEHGSRYDVMNALDSVSVEGLSFIEGEVPTLTIGYFLTRAISQIRMPELESTISMLKSLFGGGKKTQKLEDRLKAIQDSVTDENERNKLLYVTFLKEYVGGVSKSTIGKYLSGIDSGIGGVKGTYKATDLLPALSSKDSEGKYYQKITDQKSWEERLKYNKVPETLPFINGLLGPAIDYGMIPVVDHVFGNDTDHNIFIMGHTHRPSLYVRKMEETGRCFIYANSGSWVKTVGNNDDGVPFTQCTFIELYEEVGLQQISLKYIDENLEIKNLENPVWVLD